MAGGFWSDLIGIGTGLFGGILGADDDARAQRLRELAASEYDVSVLPEQRALQPATAGASATADDAAMADVLRELENVYATGGMTEADVAASRAAGRNVSRRAASRGASLQRDMAMRGPNSGAAAALASQAGQDELEALAALETDIAASGRNRAMQALQARGQLAGEMASAQDLQNRFNASQQGQADAWNAAAKQRDFDNRMSMLAQRNAAREGVALGYNRAGDAARQTAAGIGNAAASWGSQEDEDE